jgi:flagellar basal-body rod modification protein FlgD
LQTTVAGSAVTAPAGAAPFSAATKSGKDNFLQLLVAQLKAQDPLKPMEDREFVTQLAQFNALEEMQKMNTSFEALNAAQDVQIAAGMLGKQVDYQLGDSIYHGTVTQVSWHAGVPKLMIGDQEVALSQIVAVR